MPEPTATPKPSAKQIYCAAHLMADLLGLAWPSDRKSASDLIAKLSARRDAVAGAPLA